MGFVMPNQILVKKESGAGLCMIMKVHNPYYTALPHCLIHRKSCTAFCVKEANFFLIIGLVPYILTHPTNTSAAAPFSGVFTCSVTGCGYLNIIWHRRGHSLPTKSQSTEASSPTVTTSTLVIPNVTNDDVGRYYCLVWANLIASRSNEATLHFTGTDVYLCR